MNVLKTRGVRKPGRWARLVGLAQHPGIACQCELQSSSPWVRFGALSSMSVVARFPPRPGLWGLHLRCSTIASFQQARWHHISVENAGKCSPHRGSILPYLSAFTFFCAPFSVAILPVNISIICVFMFHCFESCKRSHPHKGGMYTIPSALFRLIHKQPAQKAIYSSPIWEA